MTASPRSLILAIFLACTLFAQAEGILRSIPEVLSLSPVEASQNRPVSIEAVLLVDDPYRSTFFFHDGQASCYVAIPSAKRTDLREGDRYIIEGVCQPGGFKPIIQAQQIRPLGKGVIPQPHRVQGEEILAPKLDAEWIEVEGTITGTQILNGGPAFELNISGWTFFAFLPRQIKTAPAPLWHLLQSQVRVRGIASVTFNDERQMTSRILYVPSIDAITPIRSASPQTDAPTVLATSLLQATSDQNQRVRIRGTVTHYLPGNSIFIEDTSGCIRIRTAQPLELTPGDLVEAEGLPVMEPMRPALRAANVNKLASGPAPVPSKFAPEAQRHTSEQNRLVTFQASLHAIQHTAAGFTLQCEAGGVFFEALLDKSLAGSLPPTIIPDATLQLTGLCELRAPGPLNIPKWIEGFRLQLRGIHDIKVLSLPSWWTSERLLGLIGLLVLLAGTLSVGAFLLRQRVKKQTEIIRTKIERESVLEERNRIARDWHDTMEQQLMGVSLLLEDAMSRLDDSAAAAERLHLGSRMLRHCRNESRTTICDLRSVALESGGLSAAFTEFLEPMAKAAGADFSLKLTGEKIALPTSFEHQLLRIAQEAVANAAKHSKATTITVTLAYETDSVRLEISDNGVGFVPSTNSSDGQHLGLSGMQERARRIGAVLEIQSKPAKGTVIVISKSNLSCL